ncbi:MAG: membrane protein insertion efficiency factor YidD [Hyphomicrobiaceae bacterium]
MRLLSSLARALVKAPIHVYRWTFKPLVGWNCRYMPSCSEYALESIDRNGAWKGGWLTLARICRCHPWGNSGFDPVPDLATEHHALWCAWRYGRWRKPPSGADGAPCCRKGEAG